MRFPEHRGYLLVMAALCLFVLGVSSGRGGEDPAAAKKAWEDLGRQRLFRLGTGRGPSAEWIRRELEAVDPNSVNAVIAAESIVLNALDAYGKEAIVLQGRIPLNIHPQCILGLYVQDQFAGVRLGNWGRVAIPAMHRADMPGGAAHRRRQLAYRPRSGVAGGHSIRGVLPGRPFCRGRSPLSVLVSCRERLLG